MTSTHSLGWKKVFGMRSEPLAGNCWFQTAYATYHGAFRASRNRLCESSEQRQSGRHCLPARIGEVRVMHSEAEARR